MRTPEHYAADVLFFFDGHPEELALYEALFRAVEAAGILFELNTKESGVLAMAQKAGLPCATAEEKSRLMLEWRAYVHAAVLYGLMVQAPNVVVVEYLRVTQDMLRRLGYSPEEAGDFVDGAFRSYVDPMVRTQTQECPAVFFRRNRFPWLVVMRLQDWIALYDRQKSAENST